MSPRTHPNSVGTECPVEVSNAAMRLALLCALSLPPIDAAADCSDYQLFEKKESPEPVACSPSRCEDITVVPAGAKQIEPSLEPVATWSDREACYGKTCRALGAKVTAELVRRNRLVSVAKHHGLEISFTIDHQIAVVTGPLPHPFEIWDVVKDVRLVIKPSVNHAKAQIALATVVGKAVIVDWNDGVASVHDVGGQRGSTFPAGLIAALDISARMTRAPR